MPPLIKNVKGQTDMRVSLRILNLEDNEDDAKLNQAMLQARWPQSEFQRVATRSDFIAALERGDVDLILSDCTMPGFSGQQALALAQQKCPHVPFVFVSGTIGEDAANEARKSGASDYVPKHRLLRLIPATEGALNKAEERAEREHAESGARESEQKYRQFFECLGGAVFLADQRSGKIIDTNRRAETMLGCGRSEIMGRRQSHFLPSLDQGPNFAESVESELIRPDGSPLPVRINSMHLTVYNRPLVLRLCEEFTKSEPKQGEYPQKGHWDSQESPMTGARSADARLLEALTHSELFQAYELAFNEATGMPLSLRPLETWQLALHDKPKENPFCAKMSEASASCAVCLQMQEKLAQEAMHQPATITCLYGLCETAAPVKVGPQTIGFLQTGQVLRHKPTKASFQRARAAARKFGVDLDNEKTKAAYFATPVASQKKLNSVSSLLAIFAEHLSLKSNELAMLAANAEPPVITAAKTSTCTKANRGRSLSRVASAVNMSLIYFCKKFRKTTGMNFTEFVSRTRIEKAKNLLLNRNLRVSEIAFEIGFQSLTHFNRRFQQIVGQSPTEFRRKLPGLA